MSNSAYISGVIARFGDGAGDGSWRHKESNDRSGGSTTDLENGFRGGLAKNHRSDRAVYRRVFEQTPCSW